MTLRAKFCGWLLRRMGWKTIGGPMKEKKAIVLGVPHTSAADFVISYLFYTQFDKEAHVMIKKEFWKTGYHLIAKEVGCPVYAGFFDWGRKEVGCGEIFPLTDDARADTDRLQAHYEKMGLRGKNPEGFITH